MKKTSLSRSRRSADAPERWLLLCRQSDTDDAGAASLSLESQERALREAAAKHGAMVIAAVRDADLKGYQDETARPALREALDRADAGDYDVLAVWELSRLARKLSLQERVLERMEQSGVRLYSHREPWASATMVRQILGAVAEEQTRSIAAHVSRAMRLRKEQGLWSGRVPYGYRLDPDHRLAIDPDTAPIVRECFQRFINGDTIAGITRGLNDANIEPPRHPRRASADGHPPIPRFWRMPMIARMIENPVYLGHIVTVAQRVEHTHEPIVDELTWNRTQRRREILRTSGTGRRYGRRAQIDTFLDAERARCRCGEPLTLASPMKAFLRRPQNAHRPRSVYWILRCASISRTRLEGRGTVCPIPPRSVMVHLAERFVRDQLATDLASVRPWRSVAAEVSAAIKAATPNVDARRRTLLRRQREVVQRRQRATELFLAGRIDLDGYDGLVEGIDQDLTSIDAELNVTNDQVSTDTLRDLFTAAQSWAPLLADAPTADVRRVMATFGATLVLDGTVPGRLRLEYSPDFVSLLPDV